MAEAIANVKKQHFFPGYRMHTIAFSKKSNSSAAILKRFTRVNAILFCSIPHNGGYTYTGNAALSTQKPMHMCDRDTYTEHLVVKWA